MLKTWGVNHKLQSWKWLSKINFKKHRCVDWVTLPFMKAILTIPPCLYWGNRTYTWSLTDREQISQLAYRQVTSGRHTDWKCHTVQTHVELPRSDRFQHPGSLPFALSPSLLLTCWHNQSVCLSVKSTNGHEVRVLFTWSLAQPCFCEREAVK